MNERTIGVAILDDHPFLCEALAAFLTSEGFLVIGQFHDAQSFLADMGRLRPDVALMDISLESRSGKVGIGGIEVLRILRRNQLVSHTVILSAIQDAAVIDEAYQLGATAYLNKLDANAKLISRTIAAAARGERFADVSSLRGYVCTAGRERSILSNVTVREGEVLACIAAGADNAKIAALLNISERTARAHVSNLYRKLQVESRAQLALTARDLGVVPKRA